MLARTYKTADELGIAPDILEALEWLQGMLEEGMITDSPYLDPKEYDYPSIGPSAKLFHYQFATAMETDCGTVGCAGAWVSTYIGRNAMLEAQSNGQGRYFPPLHKLFYQSWGDDPRDAKAAARRIDLFRRGYKDLSDDSTG